MSGDYHTQKREEQDAISGSTGKLIQYIVGLYVELAEQVNVFKDVIYVQKRYDPMVVEKTITDINHLITVIYPYLPDNMKNTVLLSSKSNIGKVVPLYNRLSGVMYNRGFIKLDHIIKHKSYNIEDLMNAALMEDMKQIRKEYKELQKENEKLKAKIAAMEKK